LKGSVADPESGRSFLAGAARRTDDKWDFADGQLLGANWWFAADPDTSGERQLPAGVRRCRVPNEQA
jgi:hypothetical protein